MSGPKIERGTVRVLVAYDIGLAIQLDAARHHVDGLTADERIRHKGYAPRYFQFDPPPLRLNRGIAPITVDGRASSASVELLLYDFGGVSVGYTFDFAGEFEDLVAFSCALTSTDALLEHSRTLVLELVATIGPFVDRPDVADMSEDYLVFQIEAFDPPLSNADLTGAHAALVARILRSERDPPSEQETQDALSGRVSFGEDDVAIIDWNAALLVDRQPDDVISVLEYANLQLLEVRFLDHKLDHALDRAYETLQSPRMLRTLRLPGTARHEMRRIAQMQVDGAILFERVSNALKLLGDQYLARVYRVASQRYRLAEWNTAILRKLDAIESIYQKVHDHSSGLRMEALEWIVIVLIALEIALSVFGLRGR